MMAESAGKQKIFVGKKALVTGGSRGLGKGIVTALIQAGAEVYALGKVQANLDLLKSEFPAVNVVCVDLADWDATRKAIEKVPACDFVVNNAAVVPEPTSFLDFKEEDLELTYGVNFKAVVNVSQIVARKMIENKVPGIIVNVSSIAGVRPFTYLPIMAYCCMKAALDMLTKVMALELGPQNIRVVGIRPTVIMTERVKALDPALLDKAKDQTTIGKVCDVEDVTNLVVFLLSDQASLITGTSIDIDAGLLGKI